MIVKNEEDVIIRCLESVKGVADEIILVDTGSNDNTKALAAPYVDAIYDFSWIDDFPLPEIMPSPRLRKTTVCG